MLADCVLSCWKRFESLERLFSLQMHMHGSTHMHVQMPKPGLSTARWRSTRREHAHALVRAHAHTHADVHECAHAYSMGFVVRCGRANVLPSGTSAAHHRRVQGARQCANRGPAIPGLYQTSMTGQPRARRAPRVDPPGQHPAFERSTALFRCR